MAATDLLKTVNDSGYPLEYAVEQNIASTYAQHLHKWQVVGRERRWIDEATGQERFADLVLASRNMRMVIECKRVKDSANWIFLDARSPDDPRIRNDRFLCADRGEGQTANLRWSSGRLEFDSSVSSVCIRAGEQKGNFVLERDFGILLRAAEALARDDRNYVQEFGPATYLYFPVLVTTATLQVCRVKPDDIDLRTGEIPNGKATFEDVQIVRFQKSLSSTVAYLKPPQSLREEFQRSERTVFVVKSTEFATFLGRLNWDNIM